MVHAANGPPDRRAAGVLIEGTKRLLEAAPSAHLVCVSIVGSEKVPMAYYKLKVAQEEVVRQRSDAWTIVRATQFHELLAPFVLGAARLRLRLRSAALLQPIAAEEVAQATADVALAPAQHRTVSVADPEVLSVTLLASEGVPVPVPLPPRVGRALRSGALTHPAPDVRGTITWNAWRARLSP